jgi:hypothetical protein
MMIFQTLFQLYKVFIHSPETPCPQLDIRIGNFNISHKTGSTVKNLLVVVELGNTKKVLDSFATGIGRLPAHGSQTAFLKSQSQILIQALQHIAKDLRLPEMRSLLRE